MKRLLETGRRDQEQQFPERTESLPTITFGANEHTRLIAKAKLSDTSAGAARGSTWKMSTGNKSRVRGILSRNATKLPGIHHKES